MHLATGWFGAVLIEDGVPVTARLFPDDPTAVADRLERLQAGEVLDEERTLAAQAGGAFTVSEGRLAGLQGASRGDEVVVHRFAERLEVEQGLYKEALRELARRRIREGLADPDRHVMEGVNALDEVNEALNLLGERLRDWLELHAPEVVGTQEDPVKLSRALIESSDRTELAKRAGIDITETLGAEWGPGEAEAVQGVAEAILQCAQSRSTIESHLDTAVRALAPNVCTLVGPNIAARLIQHAGGLRRLAMMPASTVQTLGAENALFRHITSGTPPPKHGVIFQHPLINRSHPKARGSIARALAGKLAIAARADKLTGRDIGDELRAEFEARAQRVRRGSR